MADAPEGAMRIGKVLKDARQRAGLDVRTVEERTKIRIKYLRALENEEWGVLPSPAYAKGFLRTYAQLLGLDADALVDEFRRQVEGGRSDVSYPLGEQVLERRRRPAGAPRDPRPGLALAAVAAVVIAVLAVLGLTGGDDDERGRDAAARREARQERRAEERRAERRRERRQERAQEAKDERVRVALEIRSAVAVCLLGEDDVELIDGQVLAAGSTEGPWESERFELRFPSGYDRSQFRLFLDGKPERLPETSGPSAYRIAAPAKVRPAPEPGQGCP